VRRALPVLGALLVLLLAGATSVLAQAGGVTMSLSQYRNVNGVRVLVFSGAVASGAPGETVEVVGQDCGRRGYRLIGSAETRSGGGYQIQNPSAVPPYRWNPVGSGMTFRARWKDQLSDPVVFRIPASIWTRKAPGRRAAWEVHVIPESSGASMAGKVVELQRRAGSRWVRYRSGRLVHKASFDLGAYNHQAVFEVPTRGLTLRAFLPRKSALPCYQPAASPPWHT
jgi:hypothetical protein